MPHILELTDGAKTFLKIASVYGSVEANEAANVYTPQQQSKVTKAKTDILATVQATCEKLDAALTKFEEACNVPDPD